MPPIPITQRSRYPLNRETTEQALTVIEAALHLVEALDYWYDLDELAEGDGYNCEEARRVLEETLTAYYN